jgi:spermidine/putrescine transport system ATP-binding protein
VSATELLRLEGIKKQFGGIDVLKGLDLRAGQGEFITLLGPSGCGKTTTLRIIAGLETPDAGQVFIDGKDITSFEPDKRGVNMVFQNYALFPHMNVEQNTGYSLKLKGVPKDEIKEAVAQALSLVRLSGFEKRKPSELSGGERQRVAVARSVINKPKALLLDEPLGALDLQLRRQMQYELKQLQKQLGITFIYITHDQEEALTMSDRIAVMRNGIIEQIDNAEEIYNKPKTGFAARFVGGANVLYGNVKAVSSFSDEGGEKISFCFEHPAGSAKIETVINNTNIEIGEGSQIMIALREENVSFQPRLNASSPAPIDGLYATVTGKSFSAGLLRIIAQLDNSGGQEINSSVQGINSELKTGDKVIVRWKPSNAVPLERE